MRFLLLVFMFIFYTSSLFAHCQIPCGIYDDENVLSDLKLHVKTIHKSIDSIRALELSNDSNDKQQFVRWVENKENHASEIQHIMSDYFLSQRIKPSDLLKKSKRSDYESLISLAHEIIFYSMKTKQSLDLVHLTTLDTLVNEFSNLYLTFSNK